MPPASVFDSRVARRLRDGISAMAFLAMLAPLTGSGAALADTALPELPDVSGDIAELPQSESSDWAQAKQDRWLTFGWQAGHMIDRMSSPAARLAGDQITRSYTALTLNLDAQPLPGLAVTGTGYALFEEGDSTVGLHDLTLSYAAGGGVQLSFGKAYEAWSFSELAHVLDPSLANAARVDPDDLTTEYAHPFAKAQVSFGSHSLEVLAMAEGHDFSDLKSQDHLTALRYQTQIGQANLSAHVLRRGSGSRELGFGLDLPAGQALLSFEAAYAEDRRLPLVRVLPNGAALTAPEAGGAWQGTVAARVPLGSNWQLEGLYLYNGQGYDRDQWRAYLAGETAVLSAMQGFDFTHAGFLGAARDAHDGQFLRRNYLAMSLSSKDGLLPWGISLGAYAGLDDGGGFGFASLDRQIGDFGTLSMDVSAGFGPADSEFARRPDSLSLTLRMEF